MTQTNRGGTPKQRPAPLTNDHQPGDQQRQRTAPIARPTPQALAALRVRRRACNALRAALADTTCPDPPPTERERAAWRAAWRHLRASGLEPIVPGSVRSASRRGHCPCCRGDVA